MMSSVHSTPEYKRAARAARPVIQAALPLPCVDCGQTVEPGDRWQVGHVIAAAYGGSNSLSNFGPSHAKGFGPGGRACNQSAGGRIGARRQQARARIVRADEKRMPSW